MSLPPVRPRALLLADGSDDPLAVTLRDALVGQGIPADAAAFGNNGTAGPAFSVLVALLPRRPSAAGDERDRVRGMIRRLHGIALLSRPGTTLVVVQFGGGAFGAGKSPADPEQCCAAAFARSLHLERPELRIRVLDAAPTIEGPALASAILAALRGNTPFEAFGLAANGTRLQPRVRQKQPGRYVRRPLFWSGEDVVLVTGGGKGITAECALELARSTGVRLALVGSTPATTQNSELTATLRRFEDEKLTARYFPCDLTDAEAVQALVAKVRAEMGPITGVVHGAGINRPRRVEQVSLDDAMAEVSPKLLGALHLCRALDATPPKLFLGLTSIIGVTGMPGNAWYAFSNEAFDLVLRRFEERHPGTAILSIAYSIWGETGMGARLGSVESLARSGIASIPTAEGVKRFVHLFHHDPGHKQVIVTARLAGLDTWPVESPPAPTGLRFIERVVYLHPGVELAARTRLTVERDPYLLDHNYNGSLLFPTVFGLEAMTQAAAHALGESRPGVVRIENISLEKPIVVDPLAGVEIEMRAEVLEESSIGERQVRVGIRTEQTGFALNHFAATLVLGTPREGPRIDLSTDREPLALDPKTDLYGDLLFQGPRFQRMGRIHELDGDHALFESEALADPPAFGGETGDRLLLGDPFFRDVLLQAGQLTIPREVCLPIRIDRIERFRNPGAGRRIVVAPYKVREGREYIAEIYTTDEEGNVVEQLTGYRLRILEERPDRPTAEEMAHPELRDERLLHDALERAARALGVELPAVSLAHMPGLHDQPRHERHEREQVVIARALRTRLQLDADQDMPFTVGWQSSGKPAFMQAPAPDLHLSLTHDDHSCLCVVGDGPQGCDLAPVASRGEEDWTALLGHSRDPLLRTLQSAGDSLNVAGCRVWSAVEAVRKATQADEITLKVAARQGDAVLLEASNLPGRPRVLTVPLRLTFGPERLVAVVVSRAVESTEGIDPGRHGVSVSHDGPRGQPVQELRFVVSFQEASTLSRRVPASRYLAWMGKMRELVTSSSVPELVEQIATGECGLVTNWADVHVLGEASANDVIQMRFWTDHARGSEVEFFCDFWKVRPDARPERVAFGEQKATWVRLVGHGQVVPEPLPRSLAGFIERMGPRNDHDARALPPLPEPLRALERGVEDFAAPAGPMGGRYLAADVIQTTLEESNLVGNVYFANYFAWQNRVRDLFLHRQSADHLRGVGRDGELLCLRSRVDYLREAMPFDRIQVQMTLRSLSRRGAVLGFNYHRVQPAGGLQKLSVGVQEVVWVERDADGRPSARPFPEAIYSALAPKTHLNATLV